jgi:phage terminase Nu1 subunit (DNA packaging protein)
MPQVLKSAAIEIGNNSVECNKSLFAKITGYSSRQVSNWIAEGMPVAGTGKRGSPLRIDTAKAIAWLLKRAGDGGNLPGRKGPSQNERLIAARARRQELAAAREEGLQIPLDAHASDLNTVAGITVSQLDALPGRVAFEIAGISDAAEVANTLRRECRAIRDNIAERVLAFAAALSGDVRTDRQGATQPDA